MQKEKSSKKALLVVSFGTTYEETRKRTIDAIEEHLAESFPDRKLYRGWTSRMIVRRLRERGVSFDTLEDAVLRMQEDGIRDVLVQPTHLITGAENDRMLEVLRANADAFEAVSVGRPLLDSEADRRELAEILAEALLPGGSCEEQSLILMGHGSAKKPEVNRIYPQMEQAFRDIGRTNVLVGTVEGEPAVGDVLEKLGPPEEPARTIHLAPLMIVAGDHAINDMAGDEEDSWKNLVQAAGFPVVLHLQGLGEYPGVREMLRQHAEKAKSL